MSHPREVIAVANTKTDVSLSDMVTGVMYALSERDVKGIDFYDVRADRAMVAVFELLGRQEGLDLRFFICLSEIYGHCPDWQRERQAALGVFFRRWTPGGPCELCVPPEEAANALRNGDSIPGGPELWLECADVFLAAYEHSREPEMSTASGA